MARCALESCNVKLKPPKRRFCCNKHKDRYHNIHNPRGKFAHLAGKNVRDVSDLTLDEQYEDLEDYYYATTHPFSGEALGQD